METLTANGKEFFLENSAPSGRYPKLWDLKCMKNARKNTGAVLLYTDMCGWHLAPTDQPSMPHKKGTWWLISKGLLPFAFVISRLCTGDHLHTPLRGKAPDGQLRTKLAGHYAPKLCDALACVVIAAYMQVWPKFLLQPKAATPGQGKAAKADPPKKRRKQTPHQHLDRRRRTRRGALHKPMRMPLPTWKASCRWSRTRSTWPSFGKRKGRTAAIGAAEATKTLGGALLGGCESPGATTHRWRNSRGGGNYF